MRHANEKSVWNCHCSWTQRLRFTGEMTAQRWPCKNQAEAEAQLCFAIAQSLIVYLLPLDIMARMITWPSYSCSAAYKQSVCRSLHSACRA